MDVIEISTKQIKSPIIFNDIKSAYKKLLVNNNIAIKIDKPGAMIKNFLDVFFRCFNHSDLNIFIILRHLHEQF